MKLFYSLICIILFTNVALSASSIRGLDGYQNYKIDAAKNARSHSNLGNIYFDEKNYNAAFMEYNIAYNLTKDTRGAAPYIYNMARCMIRLGNWSYAKYLVEQAINNDCINMVYYDTLTDCYVALKTDKKELQKHIKDNKNPYSRIIAGLIYLKTGQKTSAKIIFDEFINEYPDMIIADDVRAILRTMNN